MKSDWLEAFLIFSETLNFTKAAEALYISQPALHVKIAKLSEFIGRPLYRKIGRNLELTVEGQRLQAYARDREESQNSIIEELRGGAANQPIRLCAGEGAYLYLLGAAISQYMELGHKIEINIGNKETIIQSVLSGSAHLGVTPLDFIPEGLNAEKLTQVGQVLVLPASHRLAKKKSIVFSDLHQQRLIVPPIGRPHRVLIDRLLMDAGVNWEPVIEVNGWELMIKFVSLGLGLSMVNDYCTIPDDLIARPLKEFPVLQFYLISRSSKCSQDSFSTIKQIILDNQPRR